MEILASSECIVPDRANGFEGKREMTIRMTTTDLTILLNEIAGFGGSSNPQNANRLLEISNESTEKSVTKAARNALYVLIVAVAPYILAPIKGRASNFDGAGNRL